MANFFTGVKNGRTTIKRYFLVDYENVQVHGLIGLDKLRESDAVTIYFSKNADTISFELHMALNECRARIDFQKVGTGVKNALDFQLSSQLGYIINQNIVAGNKNVRYYIVSKDNGFSCLGSFWEKFGAEVEMIRCIDHAISPPKSEPYDAVLRSLGLSESEEAAVMDCIRESRSATELHNNLQGRLRNGTRSTEIYHALKPLLSEISEQKTAQ